MSWIDVRTHDVRALSWWHAEYKRGRIDMSPGYQRRSNLWSQWKKAHLIDSIINGFDIPKFYLADFSRSATKLSDSSQPYAVIDGKQRFEALFSYLSGDFSLNSSAVYHAEPSVLLGGLNIYELRERYSSIAKRLESFEPVVMSVATDTPPMIDELFVRLNSGVSINGAERRNAMPGPLPPIIRDITVHPFFVDRVRFSKDRMQEFNLAAKLLMFEHENGFADTKARNLDAFVMSGAKETAHAQNSYEAALASGKRAKIKAAESSLETLLEPYRAAEQKVMEVLDVMCSIFNSRDALLSKQGVIPVYYWLVRKRKVTGKKFRAFLAEFDPAVLEHVRAARVDSDAANPQILAYYNAVRTSNDKSSMEQRYSMLQDFYTAWIKRNLNLELN